MGLGIIWEAGLTFFREELTFFREELTFFREGVAIFLGGVEIFFGEGGGGLRNIEGVEKCSSVCEIFRGVKKYSGRLRII